MINFLTELFETIRNISNGFFTTIKDDSFTIPFTAIILLIGSGLTIKSCQEKTFIESQQVREYKIEQEAIKERLFSLCSENCGGSYYLSETACLCIKGELNEQN